MNFIDDLEKKYSSEVQTLTFHLAVLMGALTNLQIGTEHKKWGLEAPIKRKTYEQSR